MKTYIVNYTSNIQTYNMHWAFAKEEDAKAKAVDVIEGVKQYEDIEDVYTETEHELYCEIQDQTIRVYIFDTELQ